MAILRGFPPSNTISPSVRITEKDLSFIAPVQSFHRAGLVGFASKGPINVPTVVRTSRQLHTIFGEPHFDTSDPYLLYAAEQYLLVANELYVVRVAQTDATNNEQATTASVDVPVAGGQIAITASNAGPYVFSKDTFFKWKLNNVESTKTLVILAGTYTASALAQDLNSQLDNAFDGIIFSVSSNKIQLSTTFAYGPDATFEFVSVQNPAYGKDGLNAFLSPVQWGSGMTVAQCTGNQDRYPATSYQTAGNYDFTGLTNMELQLVIDGTDNVLIDNVVYTIPLSYTINKTLGQVVTGINSTLTTLGLSAVVEAFSNGNNLAFRTKMAGRDAKLLVKSSSTAFGMFQSTTASAGSFGLTASGTSPVGVSGALSETTGGIISGPTVASTNSFTITADSAGIDGNATQVVIANNISNSTFSIDVYNNGNQVESWGNLTKDQSSRFYAETFLTLVSDYIKAVDNTATSAPPLNGTYNLSGGSDGLPADPDDQDALLIGSPTAFTGLYALSEPEQIDIDLLAVPGHSSTGVIEAMIDVCQNYRTDCLAIVDPPFGLTVKEIVAWQNGIHPLNNSRFDTDFAALYWPWVKIRDNFARVDVWVPPSGSVLAVYARSDSLAAPWYAPAGATRGIVPNILDVFTRPTLEERDLMYGDRNCINPIVHFADFDGFVVWGQKTMQRTPTALDRVNVRRLMFVLEKRIRSAARELLFDPHDEIFRDRFVQLAKSILQEVQTARGITDFIIKADEELNTQDVIDRNEFRARIGIQPVRAAEFIFIEFSLHRTGSFAEPADTF